MSLRVKTAHYRKCSITDGSNDCSSGQTLQDLLTAAHKTCRPPLELQVGFKRIVLTLLTEKKNCICGQITCYEKGRKIPLVDVDAKNGEVWTGTALPNDSDGKPRQLQEHSLHFAIRENHVAVIQSVALQSEDLAFFLNWLIISTAKLIAKGTISLDNVPSKVAMDKLKDYNIRGIKLSEDLYHRWTEAVPATEGERPRKRKKQIHHIKTNPWPLSVLNSMKVEAPILEGSGKKTDPGSIKVQIDVSYHSRSEKDAISVLMGMASLIDSNDSLETEIRLSNKTVIKGDELRIKSDIHVDCPSGCISPDDAVSKLAEWLEVQLKSRKIV